MMHLLMYRTNTDCSSRVKGGEEPYMARNVNAPRTNAAALLLCCYAVSRWPDF
jgi:hypothetical protein